jgi:hypothetical protein
MGDVTGWRNFFWQALAEVGSGCSSGGTFRIGLPQITLQHWRVRNEFAKF